MIWEAFWRHKENRPLSHHVPVIAALLHEVITPAPTPAPLVVAPAPPAATPVSEPPATPPLRVPPAETVCSITAWVDYGANHLDG